MSRWNCRNSTSCEFYTTAYVDQHHDEFIEAGFVSLGYARAKFEAAQAFTDAIETSNNVIHCWPFGGIILDHVFDERFYETKASFALLNFVKMHHTSKIN